MGYKPVKLGPMLGVTESAVRNYNRASGKYNPSRTTLSRMIELARSHGYEVDTAWFDDPHSPVPYPRHTSVPSSSVVRETTPASVTEDERAEFVSSCLHLVDALDSVANAMSAAPEDVKARSLAHNWVCLATEVLGDMAEYERGLGATVTCKALLSQTRRLEAVADKFAQVWGISPA